MRNFYNKKTAQINSRYINNQNYEDFLSDNIDGNDDDQALQDIQSIPNPFEIDKQRTRIPPEAVETPYQNPFALVYDAIDNKELISFDYTTRKGTYVGKRVVEPHYTFFATSTGNEILVTFDRTVNDIRAFIIGNIHPNGVKYNNAVFLPRSTIVS